MRKTQLTVSLAALSTSAFLLASCAGGSGGSASSSDGASSDAHQELNALVWCDHTDPELLAPFEEANNVTVNVRDYEGTGVALGIIEQ